MESHKSNATKGLVYRSGINSVSFLRAKFANQETEAIKSTFGTDYSKRPTSESTPPRSFTVISRQKSEPIPRNNINRLSTQNTVLNNRSRKNQFVERLPGSDSSQDTPSLLSPTSPDQVFPSNVTVTNKTPSTVRSYTSPDEFASPISPTRPHTINCERSFLSATADSESQVGSPSQGLCTSGADRNLSSYQTVPSRDKQVANPIEPVTSNLEAGKLISLDLTAKGDNSQHSYKSEENIETMTGSADKYSHIKDMDELQIKLKETREFEERRTIRAAIRKLREANNDVPKRISRDETSSDLPPLDTYTEEEELKLVLHQCTNYEDKKKVRAAIRQLRRKKESGEPSFLHEKPDAKSPDSNPPKFRREQNNVRQSGAIHSESEPISKASIKKEDTAVTSTVTDESETPEKRKSGEITTTHSEPDIKIVPPPAIVQPLLDTSGADGERCQMSCEFETAHDSTITWFKDSKPIKPTKDIILLWNPPKAVLVIEMLLYPDDSGVYKCVAKNNEGFAETTANLKVTEGAKVVKPEFSKVLTSNTVNDGEKDVELSCQLADDYKDVVISWYRNNKLLKATSDFLQSTNGRQVSLTITEIFPDDQGEYECVAEIGNLEASCTCSITVQEKPSAAKDQPREHEDVKAVEKDGNALPKEKTPEKESVDSNNNLEDASKVTQAMKKVGLNGATSTAETSVKVEKEDIPKTEEKSKLLAHESSTLKPALKSVPKPGILRTKMSEVNVSSAIESRFKPSMPGSMAENKSWTSGCGVQLKTTSQSQKSWGKPGAMATLLGKGAPGNARGAMAAFKQMDNANNPNAGSTPKPSFARADGNGVQRSATTIKQMLLNWCKSVTREYENVSIDNFSTSWNDGVAFLALIHHFYPDSFGWDKIDPRRRRENFTLAFDIAEQKADIAPLLDVEDMVRMKKPDWKCVFTYVQSFYRKLRDHEKNNHTYMAQPSQAVPKPVTT